MSCGCVYNSGDYEPVTIFEQSIVTAKKEHNCYVCGRVIVKAEKYERVKGEMDGLFTEKTCVDCLSIRKELFCDGGPFEFMEDLEEHIRSIDGQVKSECLKNLTTAARARVIGMIDKLWEAK